MGRRKSRDDSRKPERQQGVRGLIHWEKSTLFVDTNAYSKPYYAGLLEHIMKMFKDGEPVIDIAETLEIVRFLEAANLSRSTGGTVTL
ncbi:hypothetical protein LJK88_23860 [Paenibacillus sp. P26]|nr:hypothetical protein LJK88_23860 [Paenibacillus sp. P26]